MNSCPVRWRWAEANAVDLVALCTESPWKLYWGEGAK